MNRFLTLGLALSLGALMTACSGDDEGGAGSTSGTTFCSTCSNPPAKMTEGKVAVTPVVNTYCGSESSVNASKATWLGSNPGGTCTANEPQ